MKIFSKKEILELKSNKYVKNVSPKEITIQMNLKNIFSKKNLHDTINFYVPFSNILIKKLP